MTSKTIYKLILKTNTMSTFKKAKVVMLSTKEKATIGDLGLSINVLNFAKNNDWINIYNPIKQHLYIISDDEIKKGDYIYCTITNAIEIAKYNHDYLIRDWKKVIATTDTSLYIHQKETVSLPERVFYLPQPSQQFIQKFVEEYNKGNIITDVMVEYVNYPTPQKDGFSTKYSDNIILTGSWAIVTGKQIGRAHV